jgi:flagellar biosynthesis protein FlhF
MHIKRYEAPTLEEALSRIKAELGPEALVLSSRRVRRDGGLFGWLGKPMFEVVAALDRECPRPGVPEPREAPASAPLRQAHPSWQGLSLTSALLEPIEAELRGLRRSLDDLTPSSANALREEIAELRRHVERLGAKSTGRRDPLADRLVAVGFGALPAKALAAAAHARAEERNVDPRTALADVLAQRLDPRCVPPRDDAPRAVTLIVGACGVGKTTTIAKIAGRSPGEVGIVTTDVHRAGGAEPLRALAAARGIPLAAAASSGDAMACIDAIRARRVLVDTSGAGRGDAASPIELARLREALGRRARVHLVVSATTKEEDLRGELRRFAPLAPDALIVAKCDDTESLASVGNLLLDERTPPLAWLGTGRGVPDDLAVPDPHALAARLLGAAA